MKFSEQIAWDIDCPHCGQKFKATAAELKDDPLLTCPHCAGKIQIESGGSTREASDALDQLNRAWDKLTKR